MFHVPNQYRIRDPQIPLSSDDTEGNNGAFYIPVKTGMTVLTIASDEYDWEHVSVSLNNRCPNWPEMNQIKDIFWDAEDAVFQFHPPKSLYVNQHPNCLHLWRPIGVEIPIPPPILVGIKS